MTDIPKTTSTVAPVTKPTVQLFFARHFRAMLANMRTSIASLRRFRTRRHNKPLSSLPPFAKFVLFMPCLALPFLFYLVIGAVNPPPHGASMFDPFLSFTARIPIMPAPHADFAKYPYGTQLSPASLQAVLPRRTFNTLSGSRQHSRMQDPNIHAVLLCDHHDPCCAASHLPSLRALMQQSLIANALTILHACTKPDLEASLRETATSVVGNQFDQQYDHKQPFLTVTRCPNLKRPSTDAATVDVDPHEQMDACLLQYAASPPAQGHKDSYTILLSSATILEPTALEKLWLYLFMRPAVKAVKPLAYDAMSLREAAVHNDPMLANVSLPNPSTTEREPVTTLPVLFKQGAFNAPANFRKSTNPLFTPLVSMMSNARFYREALFTHDVLETREADIPVARKQVPNLTLLPTILDDDDLPAHLRSELAFYKWSARIEEDEIYEATLQSDAEKSAFDFWGMPFRHIETEPDTPRVFFVMPWMQMGGSEKCMLDLARRFVDMKWQISFVFTMPFWYEDPMGELSVKQEWVDKAYAITSDVFDIVTIAPNHKFSKVLRYLLESRSPDYIMTGNSRVIYEHTRFIKTISPKTVLVDYNHMVHMDWEVVPGMGGGMPRYGTTYTQNFDLHLTASDNVTTSMKNWIDPDILAENPEKVKTCYIGTDPETLLSDEKKAAVRSQMRKDLEIADSSLVVLFAGRFVADKGIDVMGEVLNRVAQDTDLAARLTFVFVGSGEQKDMLETTQKKLQGQEPSIIIQPPAVGLEELRNYYAMADIFLLPSSNEGIALVLYEAMAAGMLVMGTDVGGQKELIRTNTGVLLPNVGSVSGSASFIVGQLQAITKFPSMFNDIRIAGTEEVRLKYTTEKFCDCVVDNMMRARENVKAKMLNGEEKNAEIERLKPEVAEIMRGERVHGAWNRKNVQRSVESQVTVGIKTYVCDPSIVRQVVGLVRSIRVNYPNVRVILANDGPTAVGDSPMIRNDAYTEEVMLPADSGISVGRNIMVNMTTTKYFVLLDDDHVFDEDTDLQIAVDGIGMDNFDVVGIRVRNLPGIEELERISIFIPRYVAKVSKFENREVTLCVWNENNGPGVQSMRHPIRVDVLHNALIAKTHVLRKHPWRNILKVNEHMSFFLDARAAGVKVGYLPSVFVHHRARRYSACYKVVRFREDKYEQLLDYKDNYLWDVECGDNFPQTVAEHIAATNGK